MKVVVNLKVIMVAFFKIMVVSNCAILKKADGYGLTMAVKILGREAERVAGEDKGARALAEGRPGLDGTWRWVS